VRPLEFDSIEIVVENEYAAFEPKNPKHCFRCGIGGHWTWQCNNKRNRQLKKSTRRRKNKK